MNVSPMSDLTSLKVLNLSYNSVEDVAALSELIDVTSPALINKQAADISPLSRMT